MKCDKCKQPIEQDDIVLYADAIKERLQVVCRECDADIQWVLNPLFPPLTKIEKVFGVCK